MTKKGHSVKGVCWAGRRWTRADMLPELQGIAWAAGSDQTGAETPPVLPGLALWRGPRVTRGVLS